MAQTDRCVSWIRFSTTEEHTALLTHLGTHVRQCVRQLERVIMLSQLVIFCRLHWMHRLLLCGIFFYVMLCWWWLWLANQEGGTNSSRFWLFPQTLFKMLYLKVNHFFFHVFHHRREGGVRGVAASIALIAPRLLRMHYSSTSPQSWFNVLTVGPAFPSSPGSPPGPGGPCSKVQLLPLIVANLYYLV